ncbi:hypothetical protein F8M41_023497 [Gigaspora margarita]|uniref:Uncharacterized protein n=1 Tax=Gigaspora margarita TaxID=4874 RepID=A0A8H4ADC8_GIGMA|nr:hypothetical protein F8M41_023497 [Gigaspora margarita]
MSNWPSPNSEIHHLLCKLPSGSAGYPPGPLWQAFNLVKTNKNKKLKASFQSIRDQQDVRQPSSIAISNCGSISDLSEYSNKEFLKF